MPMPRILKNWTPLCGDMPNMLVSRGVCVYASLNLCQDFGKLDSVGKFGMCLPAAGFVAMRVYAYAWDFSKAMLYNVGTCRICLLAVAFMAMQAYANA